MNSLADSEPPTDEQRQAAESTERAVAILAGPGSGKTRTRCDRAAVLLDRDATSSVLLLTFMNKAAAEMKARALAVTGAPSPRLLASTFHTFGLRLLDTHRELVGLEDIDVLDAPEAEALVTELANEMGLTRPERWPWLISQQRLRDRPLSGSAARLEQAYAERKRTLGVVDFDDLVVFAADVLSNNPAVAESWALRYPHLLIDEFQDTNAVQFRMVRALARHALTITVVADDDQAIMRFAGADAGNVTAFVSELGAVTYPLTYNYRCRRRIVEAANRLIASDSHASGRQMRWIHDGGETASEVHGTVEAEASWLVAEIAAQIDGGARPRDLAVLARTTRRTDAVIDALQRVGLPVNDWRTAAQPDEARAYLTVSLAFLRARLSARMLQRAHELLGFVGDERETHLLLEHNSDAFVAAELTALKDDVFSGMQPSAIVDRVRSIAAEASPQHAPGIASMVDQVRAFEAYDPDFSTEHLLDHLALGMPAHGAPTDSGGIKVSTLHRTKGLEWPHVWIVGLEEETLPFYLADGPEDISDERRLLFVGVCRAELGLTLSRVRSLNGWPKSASRFLDELAV
jgi:DNA helicase-2/ATP-dependent DNA helicase PcrA